MFDFIKRKKSEVVAPIEGKCIRIEEVPDKVFSSKMLGDGFAVCPSGDTVVAPVTGEIVMVPDSMHAFGIKTDSGVEVLVHIGLDTVSLNGEGFTLLSAKGKRVKAGEPVIRFDWKLMKEKKIDMITMLIITGGYDKTLDLSCYNQQVSAGQILVQQI
ncbi:PTS sugar transporter subunit IIA [Lacrimispora sp.]|uniref:PTS sugar transporter subunit IIA n=1 Tax=Lacrimispora sp. TaxID=2719234 RepID=UPI0028999A91|nr:PTS glucose transporter subunit IIA [Lacrimispora sp.]